MLVATHLDKENHLHNHFVLNTVSFIDGIKFYRSEKDYYDMQKNPTGFAASMGCLSLKIPNAGNPSIMENGGRNKKAAPHGAA